MNIPSASSLEKITAIRTGTLIDSLSGIGGFPRGRMTEIFGDEAVGKSTLCMQAIAQAQQDGLTCLWADVEFSYTTLYGEQLGVNNDTLGLIRSQHAEDVLDTLQEAIESGAYDLVILDSIGGLHPRAEAEKTSGEKTIGGQAGLMARFCRKIIPIISMKNVALVVINHSFVDIMSGRIMTSGGRKLAYHKKMSIRLKSTGKYGKSGEVVISKIIMGIVKKNALAPTEGREETAELVYGKGFSLQAKLLEMAIDAGIIVKVSNSYLFQGEKLGVGLTKTRQAIEGNEDLADKIKDELEKRQEV